MLVLADNQPITRAGFLYYWGNKPWCEAVDKKALARSLSRTSDAVVVLDYALFDFNGVENLLVFVRRFPTVRWLLVSSSFGLDFLRLLTGEPQVSFLFKDCSAEELRSAISAVLANRRYVASAVMDRLGAYGGRSADDRLTPVEKEILRMIAHGKTSREIAELRHSSVHTIITHKKNIFRKLDVSTSYEAMRYAIRAGIADPVDYYI